MNKTEDENLLQLSETLNEIMHELGVHTIIKSVQRMGNLDTTGKKHKNVLVKFENQQDYRTVLAKSAELANGLYTSCQPLAKRKESIEKIVPKETEGAVGSWNTSKHHKKIQIFELFKDEKRWN